MYCSDIGVAVFLRQKLRPKNWYARQMWARSRQRQNVRDLGKAVRKPRSLRCIWFSSPQDSFRYHANTIQVDYSVGWWQGWTRPRRLGLETNPWSRLGATSKCLGLESWRLGLDLDLSGFEPIAIFTQIYLRRFVTKTPSPHKLNRSFNNNPCRMQQNSSICTSLLWHMTSFVLA